MAGGLESSLEAHNERVLDCAQYFFLTLDVVDLLKFDDCGLLKALQSVRICAIWVIAVLYKTHTAKSARAQGLKNFEIVQKVVTSLLAAQTVLDLLICLIAVN